MKVLRVNRGYRDFGINLGLPVFYVECGSGINKDPLKVIEELHEDGLNSRMWVVCQSLLGERDAGTFVGSLKKLGCYVEIEHDGLGKVPGWYPQIDRWIVDWIKDTEWNYGAMRPNRDMLVCRDESKTDEFLAEKSQALKVLVVKDRAEVWDRVKNLTVRVYEGR